jgi:hypothetical protein
MLTLELGTNFRFVRMMVCVCAHDIINVQMAEHSVQGREFKLVSNICCFVLASTIHPVASASHS